MPAQHYLARDNWLDTLHKIYDASEELGETVGPSKEETVVLTKDTYTTVDSMKVLADERKVTLIISTGSVDRDNDTISPKGWDLTNYRKNPVVLYGHRMGDLPIGVATKITKEDDKLTSTDQFPTREVYPLADTVYQFLTHNPPLLRTASVGFRSKAHQFNDERGGFDFMKQELLEHSIVPIPSNTDAFVQARDILGNEIFTPWKQWAERILDEVHGEEGVWMPRTAIESAFVALTPKQHTVPTDIYDAEIVDTTDVSPKSAEQVVESVTMDKVRELVAALLQAKDDAAEITDPESFDVNCLFIDAPLSDDPMDLKTLQDIVREELSEATTEAFRDSMTALTGRLD